MRMADREGADDSLHTTGLGREPSIHQLRLYLVLAEELHFGRAASRLFMTQPALSRQIRALEDRLGVPLIDRTSRRVMLTDAGRSLLPDAREAVAAVSRLRSQARLRAREVSGHLVIGQIGAEAAMPYTQAILAELRRKYPPISTEIRNVNMAGQFDTLTRGETDVVFLRPRCRRASRPCTSPPNREWRACRRTIHWPPSTRSRSPTWLVIRWWTCPRPYPAHGGTSGRSTPVQTARSSGPAQWSATWRDFFSRCPTGRR